MAPQAIYKSENSSRKLKRNKEPMGIIIFISNVFIHVHWSESLTNFLIKLSRVQAQYHAIGADGAATGAELPDGGVDVAAPLWVVGCGTTGSGRASRYHHLED